MLPAGPPEPAQPVPASSAAHWRQKDFFHQWFKEYDSTPAAGGLTIVSSLLKVKSRISALFADEPFLGSLFRLAASGNLCDIVRHDGNHVGKGIADGS